MKLFNYEYRSYDEENDLYSSGELDYKGKDEDFDYEEADKRLKKIMKIRRITILREKSKKFLSKRIVYLEDQLEILKEKLKNETREQDLF